MIQVVLYHLFGGMRMFKFYGRGTITSSQEVLELHWELERNNAELLLLLTSQIDSLVNNKM